MVLPWPFLVEFGKKTGVPGDKTLGARERTNNKLCPGHFGGRWVRSPLHHPCSHFVTQAYQSSGSSYCLSTYHSHIPVVHHLSQEQPDHCPKDQHSHAWCFALTAPRVQGCVQCQLPSQFFLPFQPCRQWGNHSLKWDQNVVVRKPRIKQKKLKKQNSLKIATSQTPSTNTKTAVLKNA